MAIWDHATVGGRTRRSSQRCGCAHAAPTAPRPSIRDNGRCLTWRRLPRPRRRAATATHTRIGLRRPGGNQQPAPDTPLNMYGRDLSVLPRRDTGQRPPRWSYYVVFAAYTFGAGTVLPVRTLFLQDVLHLSTLRVASYFLVLAGAGLLVNPLWGTRIDRHGARAVTQVAIPCQIAGFVLLALS